MRGEYIMKLEECSIIPDWLVGSLDRKCPYCGSEYEVSLSPNGMRVTNHYCPNEECYGTIAMKMVFMWDILGVSGIKEGKSLELCKVKRLTNHVQAIPFVLDVKPKISLANFLRINCVKGIDSAWGSVCKNKNSLEEVLSSSFVKENVSSEDIQSIRDNEKYVEIFYPLKDKYDPVLRITVMITGNIPVFSDREMLIVALNQKYKGLLDLRYSKSKRSTGIYALIKEESSAVTGKCQVAVANGIPIMTVSEFLLNIDKVIKERSGVCVEDNN